MVYLGGEEAIGQTLEAEFKFPVPKSLGRRVLGMKPSPTCFSGYN